jgi:predicted DsbA family dithiol-disulfide isomerase
MEIQIWSDVVCPWCYLGKRRFEHALADFDHRDQVRVVHRAFQLDPTAPQGETFDQVELITKKHGISAQQFKAQQAKLADLGRVEGLEYNFDGGRAGNTFDAHRLIRLGLERGLQDAVIERFFRAHFTEQRSLFDIDSLVALSVEAGLDADEARRVLTEQAYTKEIKDDVRQAQEYGANGVPFFVIDDRYGISGAQPRQTFVDALSRAWAEHPTSSADA